MLRPVVFSLLGMLAAGCASYTPLPFDPVAELAAWQAVNGHHPEAGAALSARDAEVLALALNPALQSARAQAEVAKVSADFAGAWDDPELEFDLLRILQNEENPWLFGIGLSFTLPISGRLSVERDISNATLRAALLGVAQQEWRVRMEIRRRFAHWRSATALSALTTRQLALAQELRRSVAALVERGALSSSDLAALDLESIELRRQALADEADTRLAKRSVIELIGLHPAAVVSLDATQPPQELDAAAFIPANDSDLIERSPVLLQALASYQVTEDELRLEIRKQYPDLHLGPLFESEEGIERAGFGVALPLPILNGNRGAIAAADARRLAGHRALLETLKSEVAALHTAAQARSDAMQELNLLQGEAQPLALRYLEDASNLVREGRASVLQVLDALSRHYDVQRALEEARRNAAVAHIDLLEHTGPSPASIVTNGREE